MQKAITLFLAVLFISLTSIVYAQIQPGTLDETFNDSGKVTTNFGSLFDEAKALAIQPDGKIILAGRFWNTTSSTYDILIARYNPNGSLDNTFDTDGFVTTSFTSWGEEAFAVALQPDGKIIAGGLSNGYNGVPTSDFALVRYNPDGALDNTFSTDGIVESDFTLEDGVYALALQTDGKIIAGGYSRAGENYDFAIARYTIDGTLDNTFSNDGYVSVSIGNNYCFVHDIKVQNDGKIVVGGGMYSTFGIVRLNTDGTFDNTFSDDGITTIPGGTGTSLLLQDDNKLIISNGEGADFNMARCNADGSIDNTFGTNGIVTTDFGMGRNEIIKAMALQPDGKIIAAGVSFLDFNKKQFALARYNSNGSLDTGFGTNGIVTTGIRTPVFENSLDGINAMALQQDSKIVVAGFSSQNSDNDFALARYYTSGTVNISENTADNFTAYPNPFTDKLTINETNPKEEFIMYDCFGKEILHQNAATETTIISTEQIIPGYYLLHYITATKTYSFRVTKF